ncbi:hypothetical protein Scep_029523 [Stephania cephalantha]|uniref:Carbohydrate kinase PfkB domain-containing protein n=1 Tax=Stephania cephalantha TaxID=152367 RepID=A0AAP0HFP3_9MAGN
MSESPSSIRAYAASLPLPDERIILGCGGCSVDFLATVDSYPNPDDKIRTTTFKLQGGGNAGNALTCAARLGLTPRLIAKVAEDAQGRGILEELEADGVDTSYLVVSKEGNSPFTYVIVDQQTKTRTCIHTPGYPPLVPTELSQSNLLSALEGARIVYSDGRLPETAIVIAKEAFIPSALVSFILKLPNIRFVIVTLGEEGSMMIEISVHGEEIVDLHDSQSEEMDVDYLLNSLKQRVDNSNPMRECVSSKVLFWNLISFLNPDNANMLEYLEIACNDFYPNMRLKAQGIGAVRGRFLLGTAEKIPSSELVDTTGAGDAFIGAVLYGMPPEQMLPFAATGAARGCRALGARSGLPWRTDLARFFNQAKHLGFVDDKEVTEVVCVVVVFRI